MSDLERDEERYANAKAKSTSSFKSKKLIFDSKLKAIGLAIVVAVMGVLFAAALLLMRADATSGEIILKLPAQLEFRGGISAVVFVLFMLFAWRIAAQRFEEE